MNRMPVILDPGAYTTWLNPENRDTRALETILKTDIIDELTYRPASRHVNAPRSTPRTTYGQWSRWKLISSRLTDGCNQNRKMKAL